MKKPIGISVLVGLLALAFAALPAMASASPVLAQGVGGTALGVGKTVTATSGNLVTHAAGGAVLTCEEVTLNGTVTAEKPAAIEGNGTTKNCLANGAVLAEITTIEFTDLFEAGGTDTANFLFVYDIPAFGLTNCEFESTGPAQNTTWTSGSGEITLLPTTLEGRGAGCPPSGEIEGTLHLQNGVVVEER